MIRKIGAMVLAARMSVSNPSTPSKEVQRRVKAKTGILIDCRTIAGFQRGERYRIGKVMAGLI